MEMKKLTRRLVEVITNNIDLSSMVGEINVFPVVRVGLYNNSSAINIPTSIKWGVGYEIKQKDKPIGIGKVYFPIRKGSKVKSDEACEEFKAIINVGAYGSYSQQLKTSVNIMPVRYSSFKAEDSDN
jgi:hypothetical protein